MFLLAVFVTSITVFSIYQHSFEKLLEYIALVSTRGRKKYSFITAIVFDYIMYIQRTKMKYHL